MKYFLFFFFFGTVSCTPTPQTQVEVAAGLIKNILQTKMSENGDKHTPNPRLNSFLGLFREAIAEHQYPADQRACNIFVLTDDKTEQCGRFGGIRRAIFRDSEPLLYNSNFMESLMHSAKPFITRNIYSDLVWFVYLLRTNPNWKKDAETYLNLEEKKNTAEANGTDDEKKEAYLEFSHFKESLTKVPCEHKACVIMQADEIWRLILFVYRRELNQPGWAEKTFTLAEKTGIL
ncbi:MAG: hypothetical protein HOL80_02410 [Candidatus Magasanikbacteria bacterium]|jgi:hypothetical protein|nr:hypothetical protein [Candidatus Magasanikbacteria bacterium]MBT5262728.1 hypothetical protein [Candidatus Magasanikbacteria bacterium]MBT5820597.1 hypothetical protein [Candidatus Magasanikbacteria bacterium]MBT6294629.1 hypothetical protein [Candidatus Magasanikbacteria bacterium]